MPFPTFSAVRSLIEPSPQNMRCTVDEPHGNNAICDRVRDFAENLAEKATKAESRFSDLICNFFLPPKPNNYPDWMPQVKNDWRTDFCGPWVPAQMAPPVRKMSPACEVIHTTPPSPVNVNVIGSPQELAGLPEADPIGPFYNPDSENEESEVFKSIAEHAIGTFKSDALPGVINYLAEIQRENPQVDGQTDGEADTDELISEEYGEIHKLFSGLKHDQLLTALTNVQLSENLENELNGLDMFVSPRDLLARGHVDNNVTAPNTRRILLSDFKAAELLRQHFVSLIESEAISSVEPESPGAQSALNLKNHIKANSKQSLNALFVRVLKQHNGLEKVNFALNRALLGYTSYPTE